MPLRVWLSGRKKGYAFYGLQGDSFGRPHCPTLTLPHSLELRWTTFVAFVTSPHTTSGLSVQATALTHSSDKMIPHDREWVLFTTGRWKTFHYLLTNYFTSPSNFLVTQKKHNPMWFSKPPTTTNHRVNYGDTPDTDTVVPPSCQNDTSFDCVWSCSVVCRGRPYLQKNSRLKWWVNFALFNVYMNFLSVVISS